MKLYLSIIDPLRKKRVFIIGNSPITIGRSESCTLPLNDSSCSNIHCSLYIKNNELIVEDLNSKNGVFINGVKKKRQRIFINDSITLGDSSIQIEEKKLDDATKALFTYQGDKEQRIQGEVTIEIESHKLSQKNSSTDIKVAKKNRKISNIKNRDLRNKKQTENLFKGVEANKSDMTSSKDYKKTVLLHYCASLIDVGISLLIGLITFVTLALITDFKPSSLKDNLFGLENIGYIFIIFISIAISFYINRRKLKSGSIGEKILKIN